jgi:uncharacterized cupredoxin-like copper-binding protein
MTRSPIVLLAPFVVVLAAGCGSGGGSSGTGSGSSGSASTGGAYAPPAAKTNTTTAPATAAPSGPTIKLAADPSGGLAFTSRTLTAKAGKVTIVMSNPQSSGVPHGIGVQGQGVDKDGPVVAPGSTSRIQVTLKPGKYEYYCPVPAHKAAGMTGTLTVQ